jgi:hypothetical protein
VNETWRRGTRRTRPDADKGLAGLSWREASRRDPGSADLTVCPWFAANG